MQRDTFVFYRSFFEAIKCMPQDVQAEIYPAVVAYALDATVPTGLSDAARAIFLLIKPNIDAAVMRQQKGKKCARYGRLGGRPPKKPKAQAESPTEDSPTEATPSKDNPTKAAKSKASPTKATPAKAAKAKASPQAPPPPPQEYSLTLQQECDLMKSDATWSEPVCMQFRLTPAELSRRLDAFLTHCQCEFDGTGHRDIADAKRHFCSWLRKSQESAKAPSAQMSRIAQRDAEAARIAQANVERVSASRHDPEAVTREEYLAMKAAKKKKGG